MNLQEFDNPMVEISFTRNSTNDITCINIIGKNHPFDETLCQEFFTYMNQLINTCHSLQNFSTSYYFDLTNVSVSVTYTLSKKLSPFFLERQNLTEKYLKSTIILCPHILIKMCIKGILKFKKIPTPIHFISKSEDLVNFL